MQIGIVGLPSPGNPPCFRPSPHPFEPAALSKAESHHAWLGPRRTTRPSDVSVQAAQYHPCRDRIRGCRRTEERGDGFDPVHTNFSRASKNNDALVQVVRTFLRGVGPSSGGSIDPLRDRGDVRDRVSPGGHDNPRIPCRPGQKQIGKHQDDLLKRELPVLEKCRQSLERERPLRERNG